jgi:type II secretory pathway pseudopilin PulG
MPEPENQNPVDNPDDHSVEALPPMQGQAFVKVCQKCSVQTTTAGNFCPNCGYAYDGGKPKVKISRKALIFAISAVILVGAILATVLGVMQSNQSIAAEKVATEASAAALRSAEAVASESADAAASESAAAQLQADKDAADTAVRKVLITALEASVLKDAKKRETDGLLTGPFSRASCTPLGGGSVDDLTAITGTFECIAVNKKDSDGTESGYVFSATVNWNTGEYQWHLGR